MKTFHSIRTVGKMIVVATLLIDAYDHIMNKTGAYSITAPEPVL